MTSYELKDVEKQAALEKAFPEFGRNLQTACDAEFDDEFDYVRVQLSASESIIRANKMNILKTAIRTKKEYDPNAWNRFPLVKPPRGILMRAEGRYRYGGKFIGAAVWDMGGWLPMEPMVGPEDVAIERFRPWDEECEE